MTSKAIAAHTDSLVGQRVTVWNTKRYGGKCNGQVGVVRAVWDKSNGVAVDIDFQVNPGSLYGYYYFGLTDLEIIDENNKTAEAEEKGEKNMQKLTNYLNIATINFLDDPVGLKTIDCANYDASLKEGDLCVVKTARHGLGLAQVVEIAEGTRDDLVREIVTRVDTSAFDARVEQREKAAELKAKMQERAKQLQDVALFQTLAKDDPEMAQMLQAYLALNN